MVEILGFKLKPPRHEITKKTEDRWDMCKNGRFTRGTWVQRTQEDSERDGWVKISVSHLSQSYFTNNFPAGSASQTSLENIAYLKIRSILQLSVYTVRKMRTQT